MIRYAIFLWFFINSLFAASISSLKSDKNLYNLGDVAQINYSINDMYRYKLKFTAFDINGHKISPLNFSAVSLGKISFIIPSNYLYDKLKISLDLIDKNGVVDSKNIILNILNFEDIYINSTVFYYGAGKRSFKLYDKTLPNATYTISFDGYDLEAYYGYNKFWVNDSCGHSVLLFENLVNGDGVWSTYKKTVNLNNFCDLYFSVDSSGDWIAVRNVSVKLNR